MDFTPVRPDVLTTALDPEQTTATVIVGETACLLVDTGSTPAQGAELRQAVARATDKPLTSVIVTHGHWDHAFGLSAFADLDTIGSENFPQDIGCQENTAWAKRHHINLNDLTLPASSLALIGVRDLGGLGVELAHFGPAHTRSDLIVAVPDYAVILAGDLVDAGPPQFDETSSLEGWVKSLDSLYALLKPHTVVIPGHGHPLSPDDIGHFRSGLAAIWDQADWAYHQDIPADEVYNQDGIEWPWDRATAQHGITLAYRELVAKS